MYRSYFFQSVMQKHKLVVSITCPAGLEGFLWEGATSAVEIALYSPGRSVYSLSLCCLGPGAPLRRMGGAELQVSVSSAPPSSAGSRRQSCSQLAELQQERRRKQVHMSVTPFSPAGLATIRSDPLGSKVFFSPFMICSLGLLLL